MEGVERMKDRTVIGIGTVCILIWFCIGVVGVMFADDTIQFKVDDEEYFGITNNEKWNDLQNKQAIQEFALFNGYETYKMMRYTNGDQFYNNDVLNPLDAYILMEAINGNTKKIEYREYKEWLLGMQRININYTYDMDT